MHIYALGVLCCFAFFVCLTLLASFFLLSHLSFKTCICTSTLYIHVHANYMYIYCRCTNVCTMYMYVLKQNSVMAAIYIIIHVAAISVCNLLRLL